MTYSYICSICGREFESTSPYQDICPDCLLELNDAMDWINFDNDSNSKSYVDLGYGDLDWDM